MMRAAKNVVPTCAVIGALVLTATCGGGRSSSAPSADTWAAVNDQPILKSDVEKAYRMSVPASGAQPSVEEALAMKLNLLDGMITQLVLTGRAKALAAEPTDAEVESALAERRRGVPDADFQKQLADAGMTTDDVKQTLRRELAVNKVIEKEVTSKINISDQDITNFYNANKAQFNVTEPQFRLAQIVVTPGRDPNVRNRMNDDAGTPAEAERKVEMINQRLRSGGQFADLAMDYSEDPQSVAQGGDLGFVPASALARVAPALRDTVQKMQPNTVTTMSIGQNFFVLMLLAKEAPGQRELSNPEVRDGIRDMLRDRKDQLLKTAYITSARDEANVVNYLAKKIADSQGAAPDLQ